MSVLFFQPCCVSAHLLPPLKISLKTQGGSGSTGVVLGHIHPALECNQSRFHAGTLLWWMKPQPCCVEETITEIAGAWLKQKGDGKRPGGCSWVLNLIKTGRSNYHFKATLISSGFPSNLQTQQARQRARCPRDSAGWSLGRAKHQITAPSLSPGVL